MKINRDVITNEHWRELNEETVVTSDGEEIINYLYSFNVRFNLKDLVRIEQSDLSDEEKEYAMFAGFEYTDKHNFGMVVEFKTSRGDIYYRTGAIIHDA